MKKALSIFSLLALSFIVIPLHQIHAAEWQPDTPPGFTPITWVKARGVASFVKVPESGGYVDFITTIYLPYNEVKLFTTTSTPRVSWGVGQAPFDGMLNAQNWAVPKALTERAKIAHPEAKFLWNAPFFNSTLSPTDLSLALKSVDTEGSYITSGSRPTEDIIQARKMLLINNESNTAQIADFEPTLFSATSTGDQGVESFAPSVTSKGTSSDVARLFIGVKPGGKELVIYCSRGASPQYASDMLVSMGVPVEHQIQMDGGTSVTCAYNLPGQYFVEPGRNLPYLMGAFPSLPQGTVTLDELNVRTGPGTKNKVIGKLKKGTVVKIYGEKNGWYKIDETEERWVTGQYVKKSN